jgi:hypothetical protein
VDQLSFVAEAFDFIFDMCFFHYFEIEEHSPIIAGFHLILKEAACTCLPVLVMGIGTDETISPKSR